MANLVRAGEVVGVGGSLDSGKGALGKAIAGVEFLPASGAVSLQGGRAAAPKISRFVRSGLGYVPAERLADGMIAAFSVAWNVSLVQAAPISFHTAGTVAPAQGNRRRGPLREEPCGLLGDASSALRASVGGNQQKIVLVCWLCRDPGVLVLDNPTRGVDAGAKEGGHRLICDLTHPGRGQSV